MKFASLKSILTTSVLSLTTVFSTPSAFADTPSTHGMLLFGNTVTYASHLPMFHAPHDYQVILKLSLQGEGTLVAYKQLKSQGHELFTLVPETLDLSKIVDKSLTTFKAKIFDGHFEKGGLSLGLVDVKIEKVVFANKLDRNDPTMALQKYIVFGKPSELFAAHLIEGAPSFDAVMQVTHSGLPVLPLPSCGRGYCNDEPLPQAIFKIIHSGNTSPQQNEALNAETVVKKVIYFEEAELSE